MIEKKIILFIAFIFIATPFSVIDFNISAQEFPETIGIDFNMPTQKYLETIIDEDDLDDDEEDSDWNNNLLWRAIFDSTLFNPVQLNFRIYGLMIIILIFIGKYFLRF